VTEAEVYEGLKEIFADVFLRDDIVLAPRLTAKEVEGWDSFKQIEIIISSEERFGVKFATREIDNLHCVGDLVALVVAKSGIILRHP
jgi:acyl carrier protein